MGDRDNMDDMRYALGVFVVVILPAVIVFWTVMHGGRHVWRQRSPSSAYLWAGLGVCVSVGVCWIFRNFLVGTDLGAEPFIMTSGAAIYLASWLLWWPVKKRLNLKTFSGMEQMQVGGRANGLIREGIYAVVRHPRYLMVTIGTLGWSMFVNHAGVYGVCGLCILGLMMVVKLEEVDLVERFGDAYVEYQKNVPAFIPTLASLRAYWSGSNTMSG